MEKLIITKRGIYGRVNVTLPLPMKTSMLAWAKRSGMKKAEFLRLALTTGFLALSKGIETGEAEHSDAAAQQPARKLCADGLLALRRPSGAVNE